ncbi:hypothetical protein [Peribacillus deserti]|uniref:Uncharacterized protein n=1 Tax=Peribacillus deserti TaxID=673318 RepID=A0A2N5M4M3_9BACI|nr:hypothetical protein [Peribacillus deserti]PLT29285.1 hypothetical protein CUU66_14055 [Peribacillus deserti]
MKVFGGILLTLDILFTIFWHFTVLAVDGYANSYPFYQFKLVYVFSFIIALLATMMIVKAKQANKQAEEYMMEIMENPPPNINNINPL